MKNGELGWPENKMFADGNKVSRAGLAVGVDLCGHSIIIVAVDQAGIDMCAKLLRMNFNVRQIRTGLVTVSSEWEKEAKP
jgi:hypothetical protein